RLFAGHFEKRQTRSIVNVVGGKVELPEAAISSHQFWITRPRFALRSMYSVASRDASSARIARCAVSGAAVDNALRYLSMTKPITIRSRSLFRGASFPASSTKAWIDRAI